MDLAGRTIAVTGATGFLGSHVALGLVARGAHVRAVIRDPGRGAWLAAHGIELVRGDLTDRDGLVDAFRGSDAVVANAALSTRRKASLDEYVAANVTGAENVLLAAAAAGVRRVVKVSSTAVYRNRVLTVNAATTPLVPEQADWLDWSRFVTNWRYAQTKARGERRARSIADEHGIGLTIVRPGPIYGPRDTKLTVRYAHAMRRRVVPAPTFRLPHVHAADVATAIGGALANDASIGRAYPVTGDPVSPYEVLSIWRELTGRGPTLIPVPVPIWIAWDDGDAARDLGFVSRPIRDGLEDVLANPIASDVT